MSVATLKEILPGLVRGLGVTPENFAILSIVENELSLSSPEAKIVAFRGNRIYVEVESSVQLYELNLRKREIFKSMRAAFGADDAHPQPDIKFFLKGTARLGAEDKAKAARLNHSERN